MTDLADAVGRFLYGAATLAVGITIAVLIVWAILAAADAVARRVLRRYHR